MKFSTMVLILATTLAVACQETGEQKADSKAESQTMTLEEKVEKTPCGDYLAKVKTLCQDRIAAQVGVACYREFSKLNGTIEVLRKAKPDQTTDAIKRANTICSTNLESLENRIKANPPQLPGNHGEPCQKLAKMVGEKCFQAAHIAPHPACNTVLSRTTKLPNGEEGDPVCAELQNEFSK